ncbi:MAG: hypothetical protein ACRCV0_01880, partial [Brevinema sp.]
YSTLTNGHRVRESTSHIVCLRYNIMKIYLLLIILLFGACVDKQTLSQTKSENHDNSKSLIFDPSTGSTKILDDEITNELIETNTEPLVASYDIATNLISLDSLFGLQSNPIDAIYWDSNNNQYFRIVDTNNYQYIKSEFNEDKEREHFLFDKERKNYYMLEYRGALISNQLVYYDIEKKIYVVMLILPIDDSFVEYWGGGQGRPDTISTNTNIFYPYRPGTYTNNTSSLQWWRGGKDLRLTPIDPDDY